MPRQHHVPIPSGVADAEVACETFPVSVARATLPPTAVPRLPEQVVAFPAVIWAGLQRKNVTFPLGGPPAAIPVTWMWSVMVSPRKISAEDGLVTVGGRYLLTVKHSVVLPSTNPPAGPA